MLIYFKKYYLEIWHNEFFFISDYKKMASYSIRGLVMSMFALVLTGYVCKCNWDSYRIIYYRPPPGAALIITND